MPRILRGHGQSWSWLTLLALVRGKWIALPVMGAFAVRDGKKQLQDQLAG